MGCFLASIEKKLKRSSSVVKTLSKPEKRQLVFNFQTLLLISVLVLKSIAEESVFLGLSILNINLKWYVVNFLSWRLISCIAFHFPFYG